MTILDFIKTTYNAAFAMQKKYGINALAAMAQSAQETGWGAHAPGNMYFGIKAGGSWKGKTQLLTTTEYYNGVKTTVKALFRAYDNAEQSFEDYARLITGNARYKAALKYTDNPEQYITEVAKAGYATDPNYAKLIIGIIASLKKKLVSVPSLVSVPAHLSDLEPLSIGLPKIEKPVDYTNYLIKEPKNGN